MDEIGLLLSLLVTFGIGAAGVYLLLSQEDENAHRAKRRVGGGLAALSLILLGVLLTTHDSATVPSAEVSVPESETEAVDSQTVSTTAAVVFYLLAGASVVSAVLAITSRLSAHAVLWFAIMLLANSGLLLFHGAWFLALAMLLVYAGVVFAAYRFLTRWTLRQLPGHADRIAREPLLACVTGAMLSAALVGTLHHAFVTEAAVTLAAEQNRDIGSLRRSAFPKQSAIDFAHQQAPPVLRIHDDRSHVASLVAAMSREQLIGLEVLAVLTIATIIGALLIVRQPDASNGPDGFKPSGETSVGDG